MEKIMELYKKLIIVGAVAFGFSTICQADISKRNQSSSGVQITIDYSAPDRLLVLGRIQVNINETSIPDYIDPLNMSLPSVNLGNHRLWDPFNPMFNQWARTAPYYPFDVSQPTPFGSFDYMNNIEFYAAPGEAKILPPLDVPVTYYIPGSLVYIEIPSLGYFGQSLLPPNSVKKVGNKKYHVKFDTCEMEFYADECGVIDITVEPDGKQVSKYTGTRVDIFRNNSQGIKAGEKLKFTANFKEHSAKVEGSVFGTDIFPEVGGVITEFKIVNRKKTYMTED